MTASCFYLLALSIIFLTLPLSSTTSFSQNIFFVTRQGTKLKVDKSDFYAIGVNCYYLQNLSAYGDTTHLEEVFQEANQLGVTAIRTWGFYDAEDSTNPAVIQFSPGQYNESGLRALDEVLARSRQHSIRLIIPFVNNWDDYGGMNQYVEWYADRFPQYRKSFPNAESKVIAGIGGRSYRTHLANGYNHDDFYTNDTMKQWYKNYVTTILNRVNTLTGIAYKDDQVILAWELANEPRSSDRSGEIVRRWLDEMSSYIKSIDENHLVATGDEGFDVASELYSGMNSYNEQSWLFDGTNGTSFYNNLALPNIDIASIHCYPEFWHLAPHQSLTWINDHRRIADQLAKPLIVGEIGAQREPPLLYESVLNYALNSDVDGVLLWQFVYDGRARSDGFEFSFPADVRLCTVLQTYARRLREKAQRGLSPPAVTSLLKNYPNPFNYSTIIPYTLSAAANVRLDVYSMAGEHVVRLVNEDQKPGLYSALFDAYNQSSGVYIVRLKTAYSQENVKMLLVK
jgi:mannan endo-1,4-beta-mannosidase